MRFACHTREKRDNIDPRAYSQDGYLINQGVLRGITYGCKTTRETGCGWIACYNFLRCMGRPEDPVKVAREMERMLLWGGRLGSHPLAVWWFLRRRGYGFHMALTCRGMERSLGRCKGKRAGIVAYWHGKGAHYVTFVEDGEGRGGEEIRFLNAVYGAENYCLTVRDFFRQQVRFPLVIALVVR